jgi:putative ABC transport system permease protein
MRFSDILPIATNSLLRTKGRSVMTMIGIVIGIASVIVMLSIGRAAERFIIGQIAAFGSDLMYLQNGTGDSQAGGPDPLIKQTLTYDDYLALREKSWVKSTDVIVLSKDLVTYGSTSKFYELYGSAPGSPIIFNATVASGRYLNEDDMAQRARVVVLGHQVAIDLFGEQDPVGQRVKIGQFSYRVIGVMAPGGTRFFSSVNTQVYIPATTAQQAYHVDTLNFIALKTTFQNLEDAKEQIRLVMRDTHKLDNPKGILSKDDFRIATQDDAAENANTVGLILQILLGSVAAISLLVGGIGIMNIMYVSVTERTREIGLRKSIGAKRGEILSQFLTEGTILTVAGGVIGVLTGLGGSWLGIKILQTFQDGWTFAIPWDAVALSVVVSGAIGISFGYFPARRAAKLNAIDALRHE